MSQVSDSALYYFDEKAADKVCNFFENYLIHIKGRWANSPIILDPWQRDMLRELFGWKRCSDGSRRYRTLWLEIPRKNGKSTLAAGIALYLLFADEEKGAEVYSAAGDKEQAAIVFDLARAMTEASKPLRSRSECFKRSITFPKHNNFYRVISSDAHTKHGYNAHGIVVDEVHVQPNGDLIDVLQTSTGTRRQPLAVYITTAGHDRTSICWEMHDYAQRVASGELTNDTWLVRIYAADPDDDWTSVETWKKANPGFGVSIQEDYLRDECEKAKASPRYENTFKQLHLNIWTEQLTRWIAYSAWEACATDINYDELIGEECFGGLDLSENTDVSAFVLVFPRPDGTSVILPWFWLPADNLKEKMDEDRQPYDEWAKKGFLTLTDGNIIDYAFIKKTILEAADKYRIQSIGIDRYQAIQITVELEQEGLEVVLQPQTCVGLNSGSREFEGKIVSGKLRHGNNPVMNWMVKNVTTVSDSNGNFRPRKVAGKGGERKKVDGVSASVNALTRQISTAQKKASSYKKRGLRSFTIGAPT